MDLLDEARNAVDAQIASLRETALKLDQDFVRSVNMISTAPKVITSGLGKSSFIARKLAATLSSVRIPAVYIHPVDALHGDSGILSADDVLIAFSKSGETAEVVRLVTLAKELGLKIIAISGRESNTLAGLANASLVAHITREFDTENLIPTTSTTTALVLADLLAVISAQIRGNVAEQLRRSHPDGSIGSALLRTVDEVMHAGPAMPRLDAAATVGQALRVLTEKPLGIVCICDDNDKLLGIITDGDIRRLATDQEDFTRMAVAEVMTRDPIAASTEATLHEALGMMERRERQISVLPVVSGDRCVGVIRLHDIVRLGV